MAYRYKCIVSYDGTNYHGWQKQENALGIQTVIEKSLKNIHQYDVTIHGSSRTDSGVHANNQVFHFDSEKDMTGEQMKLAINHFLPEDIFVKNVERVSDEFHSRHDVTKKEYLYYLNIGDYNPILRNQQALEYRKLDIMKIEKSLKNLIGKHDFASFTSKGVYNHTIREIFEAEMTREEDVLVFRFVGSGFLRYMIRIIVGTLVEIGTGKKENIVDIMHAKNRERAGICIEPQGLYLNRIWYK